MVRAEGWVAVGMRVLVGVGGVLYVSPKFSPDNFPGISPEANKTWINFYEILAFSDQICL